MGAMIVRRSHRAGRLVRIVLGIVASWALIATPVRGGLGARHTDPAQVLPLDQVPTEHRESVSK